MGIYDDDDNVNQIIIIVVLVVYSEAYVDDPTFP